MSFLHTREYLNQGDVAVVDCDHQCNVLLMDDSNFSSFRRGGRHTYYGGFYERLPAQIPAPSSGHWNVVLHLGGGRATVRHSIRFIKC
jgi:Domain of unknown function (DUF1883)